MDKNQEMNSSTKTGTVFAVLSWLAAGLVSAGLISFLFWQPKIAESMSIYKESEVPVLNLELAQAQALTELPVFNPQTTLEPLERELDTHTETDGEVRTSALDYTVQEGDSVFAISKEFGITPETLLWANYDVLSDNPHELRVGQVLRIAPTNGVWYKWEPKDTVEKVAQKFRVKPRDILLYIGNDLDLTQPVIKTGTYIMVPGGEREFVTFVVPTIPRGFAGVNQGGINGCNTGTGGAFGGGYFIWPSDNHSVSGNDYWSGHLAIDISAYTGAAVYAADSGVVTYAAAIGGGYGNMIMIDHGNGYATLYAHLSGFKVGCGQSVGQGSVIGYAGSTGNSTGAHLHFEIRFNGGWVNPWNYLP